MVAGLGKVGRSQIGIIRSVLVQELIKKVHDFFRFFCDGNFLGAFWEGKGKGWWLLGRHKIVVKRYKLRGKSKLNRQFQGSV